LISIEKKLGRAEENWVVCRRWNGPKMRKTG
jgi:hypothetical protein